MGLCCEGVEMFLGEKQTPPVDQCEHRCSSLFIGCVIFGFPSFQQKDAEQTHALSLPFAGASTSRPLDARPEFAHCPRVSVGFFSGYSGFLRRSKDIWGPIS